MRVRRYSNTDAERLCSDLAVDIDIGDFRRSGRYVTRLELGHIFLSERCPRFSRENHDHAK
jgi:hypothetical protein